MREPNQSRERIFNFNIHLLLILKPDSIQHFRGWTDLLQRCFEFIDPILPEYTLIEDTISQTHTERLDSLITAAPIKIQSVPTTGPRPHIKTELNWPTYAKRLLKQAEYGMLVPLDQQSSPARINGRFNPF